MATLEFDATFIPLPLRWRRQFNVSNQRKYFSGKLAILMPLDHNLHVFRAELGTSANRSANPQIADSRFWFADLRTDFLPYTFLDLR